jgi:hypothetical protein
MGESNFDPDLRKMTNAGCNRTSFERQVSAQGRRQRDAMANPKQTFQGRSAKAAERQAQFSLHSLA